MSHLSPIFQRIANIAIQNQDNIAITAEDLEITYANLIKHSEKHSNIFLNQDESCYALDLENGPEWVVLDLALLNSHKTNVPIPGFFSLEQIKHLLKDSGAEKLLTDNLDKYANISQEKVKAFNVFGKIIYEIPLNNHSKFGATGIAKITYTSGTTGTPKGVCLSEDSMVETVNALIKAIQVNSDDIHFCALPYSVLLENIAGLYVPLVIGARIVSLPQKKIGLCGSSQIDLMAFFDCIYLHKPSTSIFTPQLAIGLSNILEARGQTINSFKFIAVGGAAISPKALKKCQALKMPIFEGYGLSETSSVLSVNTPNHNKVGSVGMPLDHINIKISGDGEILVKGKLFDGYLNHTDPLFNDEGYFQTGDIGTIDDDGFLKIIGRKKNIFITSFGRNISPEWIESEMTAYPEIIQAAVFGDGKPWNIAIIFSTKLEKVNSILSEMNKNLPDYAQVSDWIGAREAFQVANGQLTGNGRIKRENIYKAYSDAIERIYLNKQQKEG